MLIRTNEPWNLKNTFFKQQQLLLKLKQYKNACNFSCTSNHKIG